MKLVPILFFVLCLLVWSLINEDLAWLRRFYNVADNFSSTKEENFSRLSLASLRRTYAHNNCGWSLKSFNPVRRLLAENISSGLEFRGLRV